MNHFREGEVEELWNYFIFAIKKLGDDDPNDEPDIKKRCQLISLLEQSDAAFRDYENNSSFGRNAEEIEKNVREHLQSCPICYLEYEVQVKNFVVRANRGVRDIVGDEGYDSIGQDIQDQIAENDVLGVLTEQK